jgi:hypothetical protein
MAELELNKIVSMIMENPDLVEKIKAMGTAASAEKEETESVIREPEASEAKPVIRPSSKRYELLHSLEGFLSAERKKSLETMMTIAEVLDSVKRKES